jgi:hypothetical protein
LQKGRLLQSHQFQHLFIKPGFDMGQTGNMFNRGAFAQASYIMNWRTATRLGQPGEQLSTVTLVEIFRKAQP